MTRKSCFRYHNTIVWPVIPFTIFERENYHIGWAMNDNDPKGSSTLIVLQNISKYKNSNIPLYLSH